MNTTQLPRQAGLIVTLICSAVLTACGGGGATTSGASQVATSTTPPVVAAELPPTAAGDSTTTITAGRTVYGQELLTPQTSGAFTVISFGNTVTNVKFENTATAALSNAPVTFGQAFAQGDVLATDSLVGKLEDGTVVPLQIDVKAKHADNSVRHAVISAVIPALAANQIATMSITKAVLGAQAAITPVTAAQIGGSGFTAKVTLNVAGKPYTASADDLLKTSTAQSWLSGRVANEWMVTAPLRDAAGVAHPHLTARFDVRAYTGMSRAKVDVVIENDWAYAAAPTNITYDAQINVGGQTVYTQAALKHVHHTRWKKTFWWGGEPTVHVRHNSQYLIASKALPNYDQTIVPSAASLSTMLANYNANNQPMQSGVATPYMPNTGGRPDLGLQPMWVVNYLLTQDKGAKTAMMGTADLAGSYSVHYRDQKTDRPLSINDYPYATILGREGDTWNPTANRMENFPACGADCSTSLTADSAHQPDLAFVPYLISGDHYYMEELQFYAMYNLMQHNPGYRLGNQGLVKDDQLRGQAWSLRTLAEAAYIVPDADVLKGSLATWLSNNLDWYNATYTNRASAPENAMGAITDWDAMVYDGGNALAPWQDDFFTMATGRINELGFSKAAPLLAWKSKYIVDRMVGTGMCWIDASMYKMTMRAADGSFFTTAAQAYKATQSANVTSQVCGSAAMASALGLRTGEMVGYDGVLDGYPAYMQPALAYAMGASATNASSAWTKFMARPFKPDYTRGAQFAILPR
jgi:hypothetical protein